MKKNWFIFPVVAASLAVVFPASAGSVAYEGFDYTSGANLWGQSGGTGWTGSWRGRNVGTTGATPFVSSTGLTYTDLNGNILTTSGLSAAVNNTGGTEIGFRDLASGRTTETWISLLIDPGSSGNFIGITLYNGSDDNVAPYSIVGVDQRSTTIGDALRLTALGNTARPDFDPADDTSVFTVLHLVPGGSTNGTGLIEVYYNPLLNSVPTSPFDFIDVPTTAFDRFRIAATVPSVGLYDEIRVGDTFADVAPFTAVPEPSTCTLITTGLLGLIAIRRRNV